MEQNEIDELLKGTKLDDPPAVDGGDANAALGWDDVAQELRESQKGAPQVAVSEVSLPELQKRDSGKGALALDFILDIPLTLNVELGRSQLLINELLQLGQGSVIELTKLAGEPMDVFVNQRLIARGEVVVVNEKFGVRLTDIVSPSERVEKLR
ncbi:MAG: flagellar motor switch protein FliN [Syntrophales bacterium]